MQSVRKSQDLHTALSSAEVFLFMLGMFQGAKSEERLLPAQN
jgi:hypothetical protein